MLVYYKTSIQSIKKNYKYKLSSQNGFQIFDWIPEEYTNETVPDIIKDDWSKDDPWWVQVRCDGDVSLVSAWLVVL